jgi:hypothetical protein
MANKYRGERELSACGKSYTLRMGNDELAQLETAFSVEGPQETLQLFRRASRIKITKAVGIALARNHRAMSDRELNDIVDDAGTTVLGELLLDLIWMANYGKTWAEHAAEEKAKAEEEKPAPDPQ